MTLDDLDSFLSEGLLAMEAGKTKEAFIALCKAQAVANLLISIDNRWGMIREAYEAGESPKKLSVRFGLPTRQISNRAYREAWPSKQKLMRAAKKPTKRGKQVFYPICYQCGLKFEAFGGRAQLCPTCKATLGTG